jgi:hypothetical protein
MRLGLGGVPIDGLIHEPRNHSGGGTGVSFRRVGHGSAEMSAWASNPWDAMPVVLRTTTLSALLSDRGAADILGLMGDSSRRNLRPAHWHWAPSRLLREAVRHEPVGTSCGRVLAAP